jgi:TNP1/EN/SPM transposase
MSSVPYTLETNTPIVCCAYECLRTINYLSRSTLVDIQNLLVLGNVISNNMNAGVAWSFLGTPYCDIVLNLVILANSWLGLTIRLAQSLGLHLPCPPSTQSADNILREEVW